MEVRINAAAAMLGVSPSTLRAWERRFGYPAPRRTAGGHRQFAMGEVEALRSALEEAGDVASAVALARGRGTGPTTPRRLRSALTRFDEPAADRVLEESLSLRCVERTVEEVLLPAVGELDAGSAEHGFAWRWATGWLAAQARLAPPAFRPEGVLLLEAGSPRDDEALHAQALELALRRAGVRLLALPLGGDHARLGRAVHALSPGALVLAGAQAPLDTLGRAVHAARRAAGDAVLEVFAFRGTLGGPGSTVPALPPSPLAARDVLLARAECAPRQPVVRPALRSVG